MDLGLRAMPAAPARTAPRWNVTVLPLLVALAAVAAIAAGGWLLLSSLGAAPGVSAAERAFAVRAFAIERFGYGAAGLRWWDGGLGALQVAGYETVSGALGRAGTVVSAAREAAAIAAVLTAVALTVAARRLQLSAAAVVAVPLLFGLVPAALLLHRTADPTQLGVLWACAGLALAAGDSRRRGSAVASGGYLLLAAATAPLVLVALVPLFTMLVWSGSLGRFSQLVRERAALAGTIASLGLFLLALLDLLPGGVAEAPPVTVLDGLLAVAAVAAGLVAMRVSWLRPIAVALLVTTVTAAAAAELRGSLLLVALPLAALVLPAAADTLGRRFGTGPRAAVAGVLALAAVLLWLPGADTLRTPVDAPGQAAVDDARAWVLTNLPSRPALRVDDAMWASLVDAGYPAERLAADGGLGSGGTDATFLVGRGLSGGTPVAAFGDVAVRRVGAAATPAQTAELVASGTALAGNPRLTLSPAAAEVLRRGGVDARVQSVLAAVTAEHTLGIADFPVVAGEDAAGPRRLVSVDAIDGQPVAAGSAQVTALQAWLDAQRPPYRPVTGTGPGTFLVRYDALGVLPS